MTSSDNLSNNDIGRSHLLHAIIFMQHSQTKYYFADLFYFNLSKNDCNNFTFSNAGHLHTFQ